MKNRVPIVTANAKPFRLIARGESDQWNPTLDQINQRAYDYVRLHRLSTYFDVGIAPFSLGFCFDGTMILPATEKFRRRENVLRKVNLTQCELLLGGVYCEAAEPEDVGFGWLSVDGYTRVLGGATGRAASFNTAARMKAVGDLDSIRLLNPEVITVESLELALRSGRNLLKELGPIPEEQILHGATFYVRKQWAECLIHIWTATERLVANAWKMRIIDSLSRPSKKRRAFLDDHRTWTVSTKLEVLHQRGLLPQETYEIVDDARKARNDFAHRASAPDHSTATRALKDFFEIASLLASNFRRRDTFNKILEMLDRHREPVL